MTVRDMAAEFDVIDHLLSCAYGPPGRFRGDPLEELVATILSQNTNDANSGRAYEALREAFPTWRAGSPCARISRGNSRRGKREKP